MMDSRRHKARKSYSICK